MGITQRLREFRTSQKLTQEQLGDSIGYSVAAVQSWEAGRRLPGSDALISIAVKFNVSIDYLLGLSDAPTLS